MAMRTITKFFGFYLPGWFWCIALWCGGVSSATIVGAAFKALMKVTLFAVT
jgi:hypothetical protein